VFSLIIFSLFFPVILLNVWWICLDLRYKYKQGLKHTVYQHTSHTLFCGWMLLLALASIIVPTIGTWANGGVLMLLSGVFCLAVGLWDLRTVIEHHYDPKQPQVQSRTLDRIRWVAPSMTCAFGLFYISTGIPWVIEVVSHSMLNSVLLGGLMFGIAILGMLITGVIYNVWRDEALFKAAQKLQSMPEEAARKVLSTILEATSEKHMRKRLFFWQVYNFLIGLWPPCLLILLLVLYRFGYISLSFLSSGWTVIGFLAIAQAFGRIQDAMATLPPVNRTHKIELVQYINIGLFDGIIACAMGSITLISEATRPFSLQALGIITGSITLILIALIVYGSKKRRGSKTQKTTIHASPSQGAVNIGAWRIGPFVIVLRRALGISYIQFFFGYVFINSDAELLMVLYWLILVAVIGGCFLFPRFNQKALLEQAPLEQPPLEQVMNR